MQRILKIEFTVNDSDLDGRELARYFEEQWEQTSSYEEGEDVNVLTVTEVIRRS